MKKAEKKEFQMPSRLPIALTVFFIIMGFNLNARTGLAEDPRDILVVVNKSSRINAISLDELVELFLKYRESFKSGDKAIPINTTNAELREDFRRLVLKKSEAEEKKHWSNYTIRTGQSPPPTVGKTLKAVFRLRNGISYVYRSELVGNVAKVVLVIPAPK